jgi:hypothetical protein
MFVNMIFIYGDSHAHYNFITCNVRHCNLHSAAVTMFRIGRDNTVPKHLPVSHPNDIQLFDYGEVDCRCHIGKQVALGRDEDEIIQSLVESYINTIQQYVHNPDRIIIVAVVPPTIQSAYENVHGPITHEWPFVGTDNERLNYTHKVNHELKIQSEKRGHLFFDPFDFYKDTDGFMRLDLCDQYFVHVGNNAHLLQEFDSFLKTHGLI